LDRKRTESEQGINWITKPETKQLVHKWRAEESAILVGKNTVLVDNPSLTVREWKGINPTRIVLDAKLELSENHAIFDQGAKTIVLNKLKTEEKGNVKFIQLSDLMPETILKELHSEGLQSLIIEGGALTLQSFITSDLWDEARILTGKIKFGEGLDAPAISGKLINEFSFGEDLINIYKNL
jgi:diaminohydroxyphosphoribosylaminopyrimidine deaminase/5-amino-6-(5-phosphoribosylamino)uracil reductase